jgi:dTDP-4-dehydrorhamnose reductase
VTPTRVLITGGGGQLAADFAALLGDDGTVAAPSRAELDISDDDALARAFGSVEPQLVLNCAAFHNVDVCEREEDRAYEVNARAVKRLAERCAEGGARLVHFSTNYVFDGDRDDPYAEYDTPNPRSTYAISKLAGEYCALAYSPGALVVRTAGLYGLHGSASKGGNFVTRMIARAREQGELRMVADQRLSPTFTADLAAAVLEAVAARAGGILHLTNSGSCSWYEFTRAIMDLAGVDVPVEPVETPAAGVQRPLNGVLARPAADAQGLTPLPRWHDALADYMRRAGLAANVSGRR